MDVQRIMMSPDEATAVEAAATLRQRLTNLGAQIVDGPETLIGQGHAPHAAARADGSQGSAASIVR
jgi:hypothetical protein